MAGRDRMCGYYNPEREVMTEKKRRQYQLQLLRQAAVGACKNSAATRARFAQANLDPESIDSPDRLVSLPLIRKRDMSVLQKQAPPFGDFNTVPPESLGHIFVSPGPIYDPEGREEDFWNLRKPFYAGGFRPGDIVQNTFSYHLTPAGMMCDRALRDLGCVVVPTGVGNTEIQVITMRDLAVTGYIGTPSYLMTILEKAAEMGLDFRRDFSLEMAYVAGEILAPSLRKVLADTYGLHVRQAYITADLGAVGYECAEANGLHVPEEVIVEILDPATGESKPQGEVGEVVVTTLKQSYPLFRFGTGDLSALLDGERCKCGRTSPKLSGVVGRADEITKVRGMFIHPGMINRILERSGEIHGQAVVSRRGHQDEITLRVACDKEGEEFEKLKLTLQEVSRDILKLRVSVEKVNLDELRKTPKKIDDLRKWD